MPQKVGFKRVHFLKMIHFLVLILFSQHALCVCLHHGYFQHNTGQVEHSEAVPHKQHCHEDNSPQVSHHNDADCIDACERDQSSADLAVVKSDFSSASNDLPVFLTVVSLLPPPDRELALAPQRDPFHLQSLTLVQEKIRLLN